MMKGKRWIFLIVIAFLGGGWSGRASAPPVLPQNTVEAEGRQAVALEEILAVLVKMEETKTVSPCGELVGIMQRIEKHQEIQARAALGRTYLEEYPEHEGP